MPQGGGFQAGFQHGAGGRIPERSQIEDFRLAYGGDFLRLLLMVGHNGGRAGGQQQVGHVAGGDIVGDAVDHRLLLPDPGKQVLLQHPVRQSAGIHRAAPFSMPAR